MKTFEDILQKLKKHFEDGEVELLNTSSQHIGHNSSGMHLKAIIKHHSFKNKTTLNQHRIVHKILEEEIGKEIHAITIHTSFDE